MLTVIGSFERNFEAYLHSDGFLILLFETKITKMLIKVFVN